MVWCICQAGKFNDDNFYSGIFQTLTRGIEAEICNNYANGFDFSKCVYVISFTKLSVLYGRSVLL